MATVISDELVWNPLGTAIENPVEVLEHRALTTPNDIAYTFLVDGEDEVDWTYEELRHRARAIAAHLVARGAVGEHALLMYEPGLEFVAAMTACLYAGVLAVPLYPPDPLRVQRTLPRLQAIVNDAGARFVLTNNAVQGWLAKGLSRVEGLEHIIATDALDLAIDADSIEIPNDRGRTAFIQYTSGSTNIPRGVMVSYGNLLHDLSHIKSKVDFDGVVGCSWLPPYHDMGLIGNTILSWYSGRRAILMSPLAFFQKPVRWLRAITNYGVTSTAGPNFAYDLCVRKTTPEDRQGLDLSTWQVAFNGAEPIRPATLRRFAEAFEPYGFRREAFYPCYGMAESTLMISGGSIWETPKLLTVDAASLKENRIRPLRPAAHLGDLDEREADRSAGEVEFVGCGDAVPGGEIIIVDPESLATLSEHQVGEIWFAGANAAEGYVNQPEATEHTFRAYTAEGQGPYLRTGDLGFLDGSELYVTGRLKELVIVRGRNFYPQDIEEVVEGTDPLLKQFGGAVFAVDIDGGEAERLVVVHEVLRPKKADTAILVEKIRAAVQQEFDVAVDAVALIRPGTLPKTSSGKTQRRHCRELFLAGGLNALRVWQARGGSAAGAAAEYVAPRTETEALLAKVWSEVLDVSRVGVHDDFFDLGGQSLMATQMVTRLAPHFDVEVPLATLFECRTVAALAETLERAQRQRREGESVDDLLDRLESMTDQEAARLLGQHDDNTGTSPEMDA